MLQRLAVAFAAIFVALDVIGTVPIYLGMARDLIERERKKMVDKSMFVAFVVAGAFCVTGVAVLQYLGISLGDFRIAGGLVLLLVSLADLVGQPEAVNRVSGSTGIVPLAVPLITGPAVLTTALLQVSTSGYAVTLLALSGNYVLAWIVLRYSQVASRILGRDGTVVISKITALLLAAIAVSLIRGGLVSFLRGSLP